LVPHVFAAVGRHRQLLEAINNHSVPKFADGGPVGDGSPGSIGGGNHSITIAPSIAVTVTGQPGATPADHARMGEAIARPHKSTFSGRLVTSYADRFVGRDSAPIIRHYRQVSFDLLNCKHEKGRLREQAA
jgi:hypothetical protein